MGFTLFPEWRGLGIERAKSTGNLGIGNAEFLVVLAQ